MHRFIVISSIGARCVSWDFLPHCFEEHRRREFSERCGFKIVVPTNEKTFDCTVELGGSHWRIGEGGRKWMDGDMARKQDRHMMPICSNPSIGTVVDQQLDIDGH